MAFPVGWPPRLPTGIRSLRFFASGVGTAAFADNAFLFINGAGANPFTPTPVIPPGNDWDGGPAILAAVGSVPALPAGGGAGGSPMGTGANQDPATQPTVWSGTIRICNDEAPGGVSLEYSFDGLVVHGRVKAGEQAVYRARYEGGISVRLAAAFRIEAW